MPIPVPTVPVSSYLYSQLPNLKFRIGNYSSEYLTTCREFLLHEIVTVIGERGMVSANFQDARFTMGFAFVRFYAERPETAYSHWRPVYQTLNQAIAGDESIKRVLDRVVGSLCAFLFPNEPCGNYNLVRNQYVTVEYDIPVQAMCHPVLVHLLYGLGRECVFVAAQYKDYIIPVATDDEVERAMNGDRALAKEIFTLLLPNLSRLSRPVYRQEEVLRYLLDRDYTAQEAFGHDTWKHTWFRLQTRYWDRYAARALRRPYLLEMRKLRADKSRRKEAQ